MATSFPPPPGGLPPDVSRANEFLTPASIVGVFTLILYGIRILDRRRRRNLGIDDLFLTAGVVGIIGAYICVVLSIQHGLGRHFYYVNQAQSSFVIRTTLVSAEFWVYGVTFVKLSIVLMLKRLSDAHGWHNGLNVLIILIVAIALSGTIMDATGCRPLKATWDFSYPRTACRSQNAFSAWIYVASSLYFLTDIILALLPLVLLRQLRRPLRERLLISMMMGLGVLASCAIIPKLIAFQRIKDSPDSTWFGLDVELWTMLEAYIGIIAASLPTLKAFFEKILRKVGLNTIAPATGQSSSTRQSNFGFELSNSLKATDGTPRKKSKLGVSETDGSEVRLSQCAPEEWEPDNLGHHV